MKSTDGAEGLKKFATEWFIIQAETTFAIGVIGTFFAGKVPITFAYFFLPAIIGLIAMLPCLVLFLKDELSVKQIIFQRVIEFIVLEIVIEFTVYFLLRDFIGPVVYIAVGVSIAVTDVITYLIGDWIERKEVDELNGLLAKMREKD